MTGSSVPGTVYKTSLGTFPDHGQPARRARRLRPRAQRFGSGCRPERGWAYSFRRMAQSGGDGLFYLPRNPLPWGRIHAQPDSKNPVSHGDWRGSLLVSYLAGYCHSQPASSKNGSKTRVPSVVGTSRTILPVAFSAGPREYGKISASTRQSRAGEDSRSPL